MPRLIHLLALAARAQLSSLLTQPYRAPTPYDVSQTYHFTGTPSSISYGSLRSFNYDITWTTSATSDCDMRLSAGFDHAGYQALRCVNSPALRVPTLDGPDSPALCGTLAQMKDLCVEIEACHSVTFHDNHGSRGYLNGFGCAEAANVVTEPTSTMHTKNIGSTPDCVLGTGVEVKSPYPEVHGVYEKATDSLYTHVDTLSTIEWNSCGWTVFRSANEPTTPAPTVPGCTDNNDLVNFLFGHEGADKVADICAMAGGWGDGSYCYHPLFAALCSATCGTSCTADAAGLCATADCGDAVDAAVCPVSCPASSRRLAMSPARGLKFRAEMKDVKLSSKHRKRSQFQAERMRRARSLASAEARALGWTSDLMKEEVYRTFNFPFNSTGTNADCANSGTPDAALLDSDGLFDLVARHYPSGITMEHTCPGGDQTWITSPNVYCPLNNIPALYTTNKEIADHQCHRKCAFLHPNNRYVDSIGTDGVNNWCSGNQEDFMAATDALCLPREECEALCLATPGCVSIDMHNWLPQCYLNTGTNCDPAMYESNYSWSVLTTGLTPDESNATHDGMRDTFYTTTGKNCTCDKPECMGPGDPRAAGVQSWYTPLSGPGKGRTDCENKCRHDHVCSGFAIVSSNIGLTDIAAADSGTEFMRCMFFYNHTCEVADDAPYIDIGDVEAAQFVNPGFAVSQFQIVSKVPHEDCTVSVATPAELGAIEGVHADPRDPESGTLHISGVYTKVQDGLNYLRMDNMTRIHYETGVQTDGSCDGWDIQYTPNPPVEVPLFNCTDNPRLANYFLREFDGQSGHFDHPCQWGFEQAKCRDPVFHALCAHTCTTFQQLVIAGNHYLQQDNELYPYSDTNAGGGSEDHNSTCDGDNNWAAHHWEHLYRFNQPGFWRSDPNPSAIPAAPDATTQVACMTIAGANYTFDKSACAGGEADSLDWSGIFNYLCPETCAQHPPPTEQITYRPIDEASDVGALYGLAQLPVGRRLRYEDRRLQVSGITVSNGGMRSNTMVVKYIDGYAADADWVSVYQSWRPGSNDSASPYSGADINATGHIVAGTPCPAGAADRTQAALDMLDAMDLYPVELLADPMATMKPVCRGAATCPRFTTCVVSTLRFDDELDAAFGADKTGFLGPLDNLHALTDLDAAATNPKVLIAEHRATAIVAQEKFELGAHLFRNVPGTTRLELTGVSKDADVVVMSMVSPTAASGYYARTELGKHYPVPTPAEAFAGWVTDVMRIETFAANASGFRNPVAAPVMLSLYLGPVMRPDLLRVVKIPASGPSSLVPLAEDAYAEGKLAVDLMEANADFAVALATDACEETTPCDANAKCTNVETPPLHHLVATCACNEGYAGSGLDGDCALTPHELDTTSDLDYYISIAHGNVLSFGWRINEIELYDNPECAGAKLVTSGTRGNVRKAFPAWGDGQDTTYEEIVKTSNVYTGPIGYSHYPHPQDMTGNPKFKYGNNNLFDGSMVNQWWSECLNCNPDVPAKIEFNIFGGYKVECIKVYQEADFAASTIVVERGPMQGPAGCSIDGSGEGPPCTCGMLPGMPRCEPSMIWHEQVPPAPEGEDVAVAQVTADCGYANTQIFGELLLVTGTNWEGSYANDHPVQSACHCHQLCVLHMEQGCRSWKHYEEAGGIMHCYLQSNVFENGEGFYGVGMSSHPKVSNEWTSGTIARRYMKNKRLLERPYLFSAVTDPPDVETAVMGGDAMTITVHGAGMPYSSVKANDASDLQRVKLVQAHDSCAVQVPKEVTGISCIESVKSVELMAGAVESKIYTFCGPRPTAADADSATFSGIKISRADEDRTYKVCYCAFDCFEPSRWQEAPTRIEVAGSIFTWTTTPTVIYRKDRLDALGGIDMDVTVTRPAFGSHSPNGDWKLKLVRDWYSCDVDQNPGVVGSDAVLTPAACDGPDVCTWGYTVNMELEDVGRYLVCFSTDGTEYVPIPAADGRKYLEVLKLEADFEHPRGIFHNQQFSALAGSAIAVPLKLAGTRMAIPAAGAVTFTAGACGDYDAYLFNGTIVHGPTGDVTGPVLVPADSLPANGGTSGPAHLVQLAFDEPVTNEGCGSASIHVRSAAATIAQTYACADLLIEGNLVLLNDPAPTFGAGAGYFVEIETGAVSDLSGNPVILDVTTLTYSWTVGVGTDDSPIILRTSPTDQSNVFDGTVTLFFNEPVSARAAAGTFAVQLVACGSAPPVHECTAEDSVIQTYVLTAATALTEVITLGSVATPNARYQMTVPADALEDADTQTGPATPYVFEFVYDDTGFAVADVVRLADGSSSSEMAFHIQLSADTPEGKYSVCYCSGQLDNNLADLGDYSKRYKLLEDKKCENSARLAPSSTVEVMGFTLEEHVCATKCGPGCIGPHCFCEGYAGEAGARTLCLPKQLCADACTADAGCVGIVVHDDLPQCELLAAACDTGGKVEEEWQYFRKDGSGSRSDRTSAGAACTHFQDFDEAAGSLIVTSRVDVAVDYVFTPNTAGSIELTAPEGAGFTGGGLLSRDRITIIDCGGTCGISSPTKSVSEPAMADRIKTWNDFAAESYFLDKAHIDAENPATETVTVVPGAPGQLYTEFDGKFVAGHNLDVNSGLEAPIDGQMRALYEHQCFYKCSEGCTGDHCYCDGYFAGVDGPTSNALCAPEDLCTYLCDNVGDKGAPCASIDVHTSLNRCFLNDGDADTHIDTLATDPDYKVLIKRSDVNQENVRRVQSSILEVHDLGYSWNQMLRFKGITFKSGGTFKLCFCDSTLLGGSSACRTEADYSIEVGTIHASGVSCLIAKPELQRVSCVDQYWGSSLRCYKGYASPPMPTPPPFGPVTDPSAVDDGPGAGGPDASTRCAMMSEEEADADPQCQANAER